MKQVKWRPLLTSILVAQLVGQIAHLLAGRVAAQYALLFLPPFAPPGWLFRPVWLILYTLMGLAAYRIWESKDPARREAMRLYVAQMLLNGLWPAIFFRLDYLWIALATLLALFALVFLTFRRFSAIDRLAGHLLLPYLAWLGYVVYLVAGIVWMW